MSYDKQKLEQSVREFSYYVGEFYRQLLKEGFNEEQALKLTCEWMQATLGNDGY